ncbi:F-box protein, partial [Trifolium medium]|nr:F-box protein [Trifolium medium]
MDLVMTMLEMTINSLDISFFDVTDEDEDVPWEDRSYDPLLEIYSLRNNSWKILEIDMHDIANCTYDSPREGAGVYVDG